MIEIFKKEYDCEGLYDLPEDVTDALDERYNPKVKDIPVDEYHYQLGKFTVTISWTPEEELTEQQ